MDTHDRQTDFEPAADPGSAASEPLTSMTGFKRNLLLATAALAGEQPHGLVIKEHMEQFYDDSINHGRLYQNLGELVDEELVRKTPVDGRTNAYSLTETAKRRLYAHHRWETDCLQENDDE